MTRSRLGGACLLAVLLVAAGCHRAPAGRQYELKGQILAVRAADRSLTIRHDDIQGFMPAMTMPFKVADDALLAGRRPGDLVTGTLLVTDRDAYLVALHLVGHADIAPTAAPPPPPAVDLLEPGNPVPDVELTGSDGRPLRFSSLRGSVVALTFVYTRCPLPQFCPLMDRQFRQLASRIDGAPGLRGAVRLLSVSFDPEHDTPAVLAAHARTVGADGTTWRYVTADRPTIDDWAPRFGMVLMRDDPSVITHNLRTAIVDRQGRLVKIYGGGTWTVDEFLAALAKTAAGS